jgi:hypothetical protein
MKKYFTAWFIVCLLLSCVTNTMAQKPNKKLAKEIADKTVVSSHTGGGTSIADAVIIVEKKGERYIAVEINAWLAEKYPGYVYVSSRSEIKNGADGKQQIYDIYKIKTTDGVIFEVFFDVSIFYNSQTI